MSSKETVGDVTIKIVRPEDLASATIGQVKDVCKVLGLDPDNTQLTDLQESVVDLATKLNNLGEIGPEEVDEALRLATKMRSIADVISGASTEAPTSLGRLLSNQVDKAIPRKSYVMSLYDQIDVKQEGTKFTVAVKPVEGMTLRKALEELGDGERVQIAHTEAYLGGAAFIDQELGTDEVELIIFDRFAATKRQNDKYLRSQEVLPDIPEQALLFMAVCLYRKEIVNPKSLSGAEQSLLDVLRAKSVSGGEMVVNINSRGVLGAWAAVYAPADVANSLAPCGLALPESK